MSNEEVINEIKQTILKNGIDQCYGVSVPDNIKFYCFGNVVLTNHEMNKYFYKYYKLDYYFEQYHPITMPEFYTIKDKEIEEFLVQKYHIKKIEEKLGKQ
jgi:hypothetical protein